MGIFPVIKARDGFQFTGLRVEFLKMDSFLFKYFFLTRFCHSFYFFMFIAYYVTNIWCHLKQAINVTYVNLKRFLAFRLLF